MLINIKVYEKLHACLPSYCFRITQENNYMEILYNILFILR